MSHSLGFYPLSILDKSLFYIASCLWNLHKTCKVVFALMRSGADNRAYGNSCTLMDSDRVGRVVAVDSVGQVGKVENVKAIDTSAPQGAIAPQAGVGHDEYGTFPHSRG